MPSPKSCRWFPPPPPKFCLSPLFIPLFLKKIVPPVFSSASSSLTFVLCSFSKILPPSSFLSFSKKIIPPSWFCSLPCIYRQSGERLTIPCPSAGHGGVGWLLCSRCRAWPSFRHGGGYGSPVSSLMRVWVV